MIQPYQQMDYVLISVNDEEANEKHDTIEFEFHNEYRSFET